MRKLSIIAALGFATIFAAGTLSAQTDTHKGFYGSVGGGYGGQTVTLSNGGASESLTGQEATWYAGVGLGVKPQWAFGIDFNYMKGGCGFLCSEAGLHFTSSFYTAAATFYPSPTNNFFLKLNLGYAQNEGSFSGGSDTEGGFAAGLGFGYDWAIGKGGFIVKPFANYLAQVSSATYIGGASLSGDKGRVQLLQFGVGVGYKH
jgi:hypothetical protein